MILIVGIRSEPPVHLAVEAAERVGVDHVVVHQRSAADYDLCVDLGDGGPDGVLVVDGVEVRLHDITGVYARLSEPERLPENRARRTDGRIERSLAFHQMLDCWLESAPCRVANRTSAMASNASKPFQAQLIEQVGFATPATLVTNVPADVERFADRHGDLVYKSTSSVRSIVRPFDAEARTRLDQVRFLPTQFQERVPGTDVRVHVVGDTVLAVEAHSEAVDYRYAARDGAAVDLCPVELPDDVADRCRRLSRLLDLPFSGVDLRRTPDGRWYCFEVNPSPGYSYYEVETGQPISDGLVSWLAGKA